ncbi:MAG: NAD(P)H-binding protein [Bryobacterales bacterium]|nr:NAD(P)H-binding protein [Bryobacterales bacterium]
MTKDARDDNDQPVVLIAGASGYIGGRLLLKLEQAGYRIRCLSRHPEYLQSRLGPKTVALRGDVLDAESLRPALAGVQVAYYLVHSMASGARFRDLDLDAAHTFGRIAKEQGVGPGTFFCPD